MSTLTSSHYLRVNEYRKEKNSETTKKIKQPFLKKACGHKTAKYKRKSMSRFKCEIKSISEYFSFKILQNSCNLLLRNWDIRSRRVLWGVKLKIESNRIIPWETQRFSGLVSLRICIVCSLEENNLLKDWQNNFIKLIKNSSLMDESVRSDADLIWIEIERFICFHNFKILVFVQRILNSDINVIEWGNEGQIHVIIRK